VLVLIVVVALPLLLSPGSAVLLELPAGCAG
jgi:hypothetical protein